MAMQPTHNSRRILLPVRQWFILFSLAGACASRCGSAWARPSSPAC